MPFPLAHPVAVLPLRRLCPRFLSFPALIVGSISPDVAYVFHWLDLEQFSHGMLGTLVFSLPVGVLILWMGHSIGALPSKYFGLRPSPVVTSRARPLSVAVSVLIGACTHIVWDAFTNKSGWVVMHLPALQRTLIMVVGHQVRICHLLWYACSFLGLAWLCRTYYKDEGMNARSPELEARRFGQIWGKSLICGVFVLPIGVIHHLIPGWIGALAVGTLTLLLIAAIVQIKEYEPITLE